MHKFLAAGAAACTLIIVATSALADPLPSWVDAAAKQRIVDFVDRVTDPASADYVTAADRIAVFDNDGTLWSEQPLYFQAIFAFDALAAKAKTDPSILTTDARRAAAKGDYKAALAGGETALLDIIEATHANQSVDAFQESVRAWLATARHPKTGMAYDAMVFQPMLELLSYLRDEGFATYIVSGGGIHFMRAFAEDAYGIPPEQVIGSAGKSRYEVVDGVPMILKDPGIAFIDDKGGKPVGIDTKIGKRPILVGGNSDGDFQMLEWATAGDGPRFGLIVHHDDAEREYAYDRDSHIGKLARGLDEAAARGWLVVSMKNDWKTIFPEAR